MSSPTPNLFSEAELREQLNSLHREILGTHATDDKCIEDTLHLIRQQNLALLAELEGKLPEKPDTYLLGCEKHWSDDSNATCTCDENERVATRYFKEATNHIRATIQSLRDEIK